VGISLSTFYGEPLAATSQAKQKSILAGLSRPAAAGLAWFVDRNRRGKTPFHYPLVSARKQDYQGPGPLQSNRLGYAAGPTARHAGYQQA
jgi:hypothetical protein